MAARPAWLTVLAGVGLTVFGAIGILAGEGDRLTFDTLDPWVVVYAIGLFVALGALPFVLRARLASRFDDEERQWERALPAWGGIAALAGGAFLLVGLAGGFGTATAAGAISVVGMLCCGLVVVGVLVLLLGG